MKRIADRLPKALNTSSCFTLCMRRLDFLNYTNRSPYKEVLACLALEEGVNLFELMNKVIDRSVGLTASELKKALIELEFNGLIARVNDCYLFNESWLRELVLFLDEFEESKKELDLCQLMLEKNKENTLSLKKNEQQKML